jgi:hypothetical protein
MSVGGGNRTVRKLPLLVHRSWLAWQALGQHGPDALGAVGLTIACELRPSRLLGAWQTSSSERIPYLGELGRDLAQRTPLARLRPRGVQLGIGLASDAA